MNCQSALVDVMPCVVVVTVVISVVVSLVVVSLVVVVVVVVDVVVVDVVLVVLVRCMPITKSKTMTVIVATTRKIQNPTQARTTILVAELERKT